MILTWTAIVENSESEDRAELRQKKPLLRATLDNLSDFVLLNKRVLFLAALSLASVYLIEILKKSETEKSESNNALIKNIESKYQSLSFDYMRNYIGYRTAISGDQSRLIDIITSMDKSDDQRQIYAALNRLDRARRDVITILTSYQRPAFDYITYLDTTVKKLDSDQINAANEEKAIQFGSASSHCQDIINSIPFISNSQLKSYFESLKLGQKNSIYDQTSSSLNNTVKLMEFYLLSYNLYSQSRINLRQDIDSWKTKAKSDGYFILFIDGCINLEYTNIHRNFYSIGRNIISLLEDNNSLISQKIDRLNYLILIIAVITFFMTNLKDLNLRKTV